MSELEIKYLIELLLQLKRAKKTLEYSYEICKNFGEKDFYTQEEEDRFEAFTSKFARLSDLILKKAIKTINILDLDEPAKTMRDAIARAEKKGLIAEEFKFIEIRKKRNEIAHEYIANEEELINIYKYVLNNCQYLFDSVDKIENYTQKFLD
ncbi:MAG: hypothetical protein KAI83_15580 [Thiomargarita sp.]|jgi:selenocysteine lyase/cysteine desulfurase|nr:hypothetical protein [Thiomargarita sp.]